MEFNNLRRNILAHIGTEWRQSNNRKSFFLDDIRSEYSDIPDNNVEGAIHSLQDKDFILLSDNQNTVRLTQKGLNQLRIIKDRKTNDEVIMAKKID